MRRYSTEAPVLADEVKRLKSEYVRAHEHFRHVAANLSKFPADALMKIEARIDLIERKLKEYLPLVKEAA